MGFGLAKFDFGNVHVHAVCRMVPLVTMNSSLHLLGQICWIFDILNVFCVGLETK